MTTHRHWIRSAGYRRLSVWATIALVFLSVALYRMHLYNEPGKSHEEIGATFADLEPGARVCLPGLYFSDIRRSRMVVVIKNHHCPACGENEAFEQLLEARCAELGIPVTFLIPERPDEDAYGDKLRSQGRHVVRADLDLVGIRRVPSMIAIDREGLVLAKWSGTVRPELAQRALALITSGVEQPSYSRIRSTDLKATCAATPCQIVLPSKRSEVSLVGVPVVQIPISELGVRAKYELRRDLLTVVNCAAPDLSDLGCQEAVMILLNSGFKHLASMDLRLPRESAYCGAEHQKSGPLGKPESGVKPLGHD